MPEEKPRPDFFTRFQPGGGEGLVQRPICVRLPAEIDAAIRQLPGLERSRWLRRVIVEAATRELLGEQSHQTGEALSP